MKTGKRGVQARVGTELTSQRLEVAMRRQPQLGLPCPQPVLVHIQHAIRPAGAANGRAGVHLARVHHQYAAGGDLVPLVAVQIVTVAAINHAQRERLVRVFFIADLAAVRDGAGFDEGQGVITPEAGCLLWVCVCLRHRCVTSSRH